MTNVINKITLLTLSLSLCIISPAAFAYTKTWTTVNKVPQVLSPSVNPSGCGQVDAPPLAAPAFPSETYSSISISELDSTAICGASGTIKYTVPGRDDLGYCEIHYQWLLSYANPTWRDAVYVDSFKNISCSIENNDSQITFSCKKWPSLDLCGELPPDTAI